MKGRLLIDGPADNRMGLSVDDALTQSASTEDIVTLRLYSYLPCVLVGRFQHVEDEVNLDKCKSLQMPVNRRPTGGGSIFMGPDQLGIALIIPPGNRKFGSGSAKLMAVCAQGIVKALDGLGIEAEFHGKNDLVVSGRKIAGLGLYQAHNGGILFHASLLLDLDIQLMLEVLRTAFEKTLDKGFKAVSERITTLHREIGPALLMTDLIQAIRSGYEEEFSFQFEVGSMNERETALTKQLFDDQYSTERWIFQTASRIRDRVGQYQLHTTGGNLDVRAIVAGRTVKSVFLNGDFIASDNAIFDLESSLRWHTKDFSALSHTISKSFERNSRSWNQVSAYEIERAILGAVERSGIESANTISQSPNACFARKGAG